ncbi:MAG: hypothetical protein IMZ53_09890 [Thermoplasmata archaeon]|nr:hypothetical protein [Thermoplasmata archaeon]
MIDVQISGTLPKFKTGLEIMKVLANVVDTDVRQTVREAPDWQPRLVPAGQATLDYIVRTIKTEFGNDFVQTSWGSGKSSRYAKVHERGMSITKTPAMRRAMWAKLSALGLKWNGTTRPFLTIPARPVIPSIMAMKDKYAGIVGKELTMTKSVPIFEGMTR